MKLKISTVQHLQFHIYENCVTRSQKVKKKLQKQRFRKNLRNVVFQTFHKLSMCKSYL